MVHSLLNLKLFYLYHLSQFNIYKAVNLDRQQSKIIFTIKQNDTTYNIYYDDELVSSAQVIVEKDNFKQFDFLRPSYDGLHPSCDNSELKITGDIDCLSSSIDLEDIEF